MADPIPSEEPGNSELSEHREKFLQLLRHQVDKALEHRVSEKEAQAGERGLNERNALEVAKLREVNTNMDPSNEDNNIIAVKNPHDYADLLRMALEAIKTNPSRIQPAIDKITEHEMGHWVASLDTSVKDTAFGVMFIGTESGLGGFIPIMISRHVRKSYYNDNSAEEIHIALGPTSPSEADLRDASGLGRNS